MKKMQGFTLIEVMIAIAIIAILAAVAVPSYTEYTIKAKRSDARAALTNMAAALTEYYGNNNRYVYTNDVTLVGGPDSPEGYYVLSITMPASADSYTINAQAQLSQLADDACRVITLTSTGVKSGLTSGGVVNDECW